jgi:hypothetical protein
MVTQGAHPSNAQLGERNAFTFRNCPQSAQELERYLCRVVWESVNCQRGRDGGMRKSTYIILETAASTICE